MSRAVTAVDQVFRALSDPTRRSVLERLARGPASVSELAQGSGMSLPSFVQHLGVLEECRLVASQKSGRVRTYRLERDRLDLAENWLAQQRNLWEQRLNQLDAYLETLNDTEPRS